MKRDWEDIVQIVSARRDADFKLKRDMVSVRDRYNGDLVLPLYDVKGQPIVSSLAPQIVADAIEAGAERASSVPPSIYVPALTTSDLSKRKANSRRDAYYATWADNNVELMLHRAYRHLWGYGVTAFLCAPDLVNGRIAIELRDPLTAYPEPRSPEDLSLADNCAFVYGRSADYMAATYPRDVRGDDMSGFWRQAGAYGDLIDVLEWFDADQITVGVLGTTRDRSISRATEVVSGGRCLSSTSNKAGVCPVVVPQAVTLDRIASSVKRIIGITDLLDRFMALESIAAEKGVFPDRYVIGTDNRQPQIIGGWKDGRSGDVNTLMDVSKIGELVSNTSQSSLQMISMLDRNARGSGGAPALFGGELTGSLRSGQTVNALGAFAVDPKVAEMQTIMAAQLTILNEAVCASYKGWYGGKSFSMWSGRPSDPVNTAFTPNVDFESHLNAVRYSFPGSDISSITVALGQAVGAGLLSKGTARVKHPMVEQPEYEDERITVEFLTQAMLEATGAQAAQGTLPPNDIARIQTLVMSGKSLAEAITQTHEEAQRRQAAQAPAPEAGMAAAPEAMPGIAQPGAGAESQPPQSVAPPDQAVQNIRALQLAYKSSPGPALTGAA